MARFRVRGLSPDGQVHSETVRAATLADAVRQVEANGRRVQSIQDGNTVRNHEPAALAPPAAPRELPHGVTGAAGGIVLAAIGGLFTAVASIFIIAGLGLLINGNSNGWFMTLFPCIHFTVGASMLVYVWKTREKRRRLYRDGIATVAVLDRAGVNPKVRVNGRNPFIISWTFYLGDDAWHGKRSSMNQALSTFVEGDRIWVLYDPQDPSDSVEWPPT